VSTNSSVLDGVLAMLFRFASLFPLLGLWALRELRDDPKLNLHRGFTI
jgi:hypothetical protein